MSRFRSAGSRSEKLMETQSIVKPTKACHFCVNNIREIDYKDTNLLRKFINAYSKIFPSRRTGTCAKHQRKLSIAVKRSRVMALIPFTSR